MNLVDLSLLPKYGANKVNWKKAVGGTIPFQLDNVQGELIVLEVENVGNTSDKRIKVKYNNKETWLTRVSLVNGDFRRLTNVDKPTKVAKRSEFSKGQIISDDTRNLLLIKEGYKTYNTTSVRGFIYECLDCGCRGFKPNAHLRKGTGCKNFHCRNKKALVV